MVFPDDPQQLFRHPSQLYEAALEGILLFAVLARWVLDHPEAVRGRTVLDFGAGSGVVAVAADFGSQSFPESYCFVRFDKEGREVARRIGFTSC